MIIGLLHVRFYNVPANKMQVINLLLLCVFMAISCTQWLRYRQDGTVEKKLQYRQDGTVLQLQG